MKKFVLLPSLRLWFAVSLLGYIVNIAILPNERAVASTPMALLEVEAKENKREIIELSEFETPVTNISGLLSQSSTPTNADATPGEIVSITGVKANPTDKGLEVILQTAQARNLQVVNRSSGNNFIADIPNAQLQLPSGDTFKFSSEKPLQC